MSRNRKGKQVVGYLLPVVAGILLAPAIAPIIVWTNACGYRNSHSPTLDIQPTDRVISILTGFTNAVIFAAFIREISSDGGNVLYSPMPRVDRNGLIADSAPGPILTKVPTHLPVGEENNDTGLDNETQNHE